MLLEARTLLGAPGLTTRSKKLLGTKGIAPNGASRVVRVDGSHFLERNAPSDSGT